MIIYNVWQSRCFLNRCITSRTPTKRQQKKKSKVHKLINGLRWKRKNFYTLPIFPKPLKSNATSMSKELCWSILNHFPFIEKKEDFNKENTNYSIIYLRQEHFKNGTVRITRPGIYVLQEDIIFEPNKDNDFLSNNGPNNIRPISKFFYGSLSFGFFCRHNNRKSDNVLLNLNQKTIKQSALHKFAATISMQILN